MFNQILTKLESLFSRSFWLGSFLPVSVVAVLHLIIAEHVFPNLSPLESFAKGDLGSLAGDTALFFLAMIVLAHVLTPFTPFIRALLDGQQMPDLLHDWLRRDRIPKWRAAAAKLESAKRAYAAFKYMNSAEVPKLWSAARAGNALGCAKDLPSIDAGELAVKDLQAEMWLTRIPTLASAQSAIGKLIVALNKNAAVLPVGHPDEGQSNRLAQSRDLLIGLIGEAEAEATYRISRIFAKYHRIDLLPTRVGDARRFTERYSEDTYRVEFNFIWTRIQMLLPKASENFPQRLRDAQSQVNSSVLMLALAVTVPLVWLPILLAIATTPWLFLTIGLVSVLVLLFLYEQVVQSQNVFGEVVRAAIDQYRLKVLTKIMNQPLPATLAAERVLWQRLQMAREPDNEQDIAYTHHAES